MNTRYSGKAVPKTQVNNRRSTARYDRKSVSRRDAAKYRCYEVKKRKPCRRGYRKRINPLAAFAGTLGGTLVVGALVIVCIALPRYMKAHRNEEINVLDFVEAIPATLANDESILLSKSEDVLGARESSGEKYANIIDDPEYLEANNIFLKDGNREDEVTLGFVGDILFDDEYAPMASLIQRGGDLAKSIDSITLRAMNDVDVMVVNNEFPFTQRGERQQDKQFTFRADYSTAEYLMDMGADVAILANNHVYDYGEEGLLDTLDTLNNVGVHPVGAGKNLMEAVTPVYYIINDIKVAIIAATQIERLDNPNTIGAKDDKPGVFRCWNSDLIYTAIDTAKQNADYVIVCVHWGTEKDPEPDYWQTLQAPKLAEAGADLIVGDHTHRLQGVYYYGDTPCVYSLGNFWFNGANIDTGMLEVTLNKDGLKTLRFRPAIQSNSSVHLVGGEEYTRILDYVRSLSRGTMISDEGFIEKNA